MKTSLNFWVIEVSNYLDTEGKKEHFRSSFSSTERTQTIPFFFFFYVIWRVLHATLDR